MDTGPDRIPTNLRTLLIVEALARAGRPLTPTEINVHVGLPKQSMHRLCNTLVNEGFLARDIDPRRLRPSARLRALAAGVFAASRSEISRHQVLEWVAAEVRETVNFVVPEPQGMRYLDRVETDWPFRIQLPIGSHVPFHCTASGKTYLASLAPKRRAGLIGSIALAPHTERTITTGEALMAEASRVASEGHAVDDEEFIEGMVAIAVPIIDPQGHFFAALAFHGPRQRLSLGQAREKLPILNEGARRLRALFFHE